MCFTPKKVTHKDGSIDYYPCGHCLSCLKTYQDSWNARLNEELKVWKPLRQERAYGPPALFFTLTYRNETIPCSYLVVTSRGYYLTSNRPACEILPFWTSYTEAPSVWKARRQDILSRYWRQMRIVSLTRERRPTLEEIKAGQYQYNPTRVTKYLRAVDGKFYPHNLDAWELLYLGDMPEDDCDIVCFDKANQPLHDDVQVYEDDGGEILFAIEFHTLEKKPVQDAFKRFRITLARKYPETFGQAVNPRQRTTWTDLDGQEQPYPSALLTSTYHYFITTEYGDRYHRPHLHGVIFGVTYDEFKLFVKDWEARYGHVDCRVYDASLGGFTYITKYCSKGGYEHPLCRRHYLYHDTAGMVKEYHSKDFQECVSYFGINKPLVSPTFHLISKGIGASYCYSAEIQKYFGVILSQLYTPSGRLRYVCHDDSRALQVNYKPEELARFINANPEDLTPLYKSLRIVHHSDGSITLKKYAITRKYEKVPDPLWPGHFLKTSNYTETLQKIGESYISSKMLVSASVEEQMLNKKYTRCYVTSKKHVYNNPAWHWLGRAAVGIDKKEQALSLPRYYRGVLLSPLASALRSAAADRVHPSPYANYARALREFGPEDPRTSDALALLRAQQDRDSAIASRLWKHSNSCYYNIALTSPLA